jgi:hypothetical protein
MVRLDEIIDMDGFEGLTVIWRRSNFNTLRTWRDGTIAAILTTPVCKALCYPIDRVLNVGKSAQFSDRKAPFSTRFISIMKHTELNTIYPSLVRTVPQYITMFGLYHTLRRAITDSTATESTGWAVFKSSSMGSLSGFASTLVFYPLEAAHKHKIIDDGRLNRHFGLVKALEYKYVEGGARSSYQGMSIALLGSFVYRGLYFGGYEFAKRYSGRHEREKRFKDLIPCALASTLIATAFIHPIDALRMNYLTACYQAVFHYNSVGPFEFAWRKMTVGKYVAGIHWNLGKSIPAAVLLAAFDVASHKKEKK